jgi:hypothetical protein
MLSPLSSARMLQNSGDASVAENPAQQTGMAAGAAQKGEFDAQHRPVTAGGFVKTGPVVFQNVAAQAGLTHWRNTTGTPAKHVIIEAKGSGVCLLDFDHDGWLDIYLVNGSTLDALSGKGAAACGTVPQQPRRYVHRRHGKGRSRQRPLGTRMRRGRL